MSGESVYLCPRCLSASAHAGACDMCGRERLGCRPGAPDDPCRKPVIDSRGHVRTRAPLWWLRMSVTPLADDLERRARSTT
jgi:hypothetical protein